MIYGNGERGKSLALELTGWSDDILLCTDGPAQLTLDERARLVANGIVVNEIPITWLEGSDGLLAYVHLQDGQKLARRALFFNCGERQGSELPLKLGCTFTKKGAVETGRFEKTDVLGRYIAGDAARSVHLSMVAAAHGAEAAFAINTELLKENLA